MLAVFDVIF